MRVYHLPSPWFTPRTFAPQDELRNERDRNELVPCFLDDGPQPHRDAGFRGLGPQDEFGNC